VKGSVFFQQKMQVVSAENSGIDRTDGGHSGIRMFDSITPLKLMTSSAEQNVKCAKKKYQVFVRALRRYRPKTMPRGIFSQKVFLRGNETARSGA
jgi:hypothetical protein